MNGNQTIYLAAGCFWCTEAVFSKVKGVVDVQSGYSGGFVKNPCYREVCNGTTGHAECIQLKYDPTQIELNQLFAIFFATHDPTTLNRQGYDVGTQYRSAIFYTTERQRAIATEYIEKLENQKAFDSPIVTEVTPFNAFYPAESEHHKYYELHSEARYCTAVILPKLNHLELQFAPFLTNE